MPVREGSAVWKGDLKGGKGFLKFGNGTFSGEYSFSSRFEQGKGTNPEELIGAAHAACFSMAFAGILAKAGHEPKKISTTGKVALELKDGGFWISSITLVCEADVPGIGNDEFMKHAASAKTNCPVSKLLTGTEIRLEVRLLQTA